MIDFREYLSSTSTDPKKILKLVISISVLLLVIWLFMVSRMEFSEGSKNSDAALQERADSIRSTLLQPDRPGGNQLQDTDRSSGVFLNAFTTFIILIALLAGVWLWIRKQSGPGQENQFHELGTHTLGNGAQLKVMELNGEIWILGITSGSVNLLHRCPKEEWNPPRTPDPRSETGAGEKSFYHIFKKKT